MNSEGADYLIICKIRKLPFLTPSLPSPPSQDPPASSQESEPPSQP
jgi:hypothetical protein